nr:gliding motility-associated C-terminal domain-containing protein [Prolixibacteraceae bacterium]
PVLLDGGASTGAGPLKYTWWINDYDDTRKDFAYSDTVTVTQTDDYYLTITDRFGCTNTDLMHVGYPIDPFIAVDDCPIVTAQQEPVDVYVLRNDIIDPDDEYELEYLMVIQQPLHGYVIEHPFDSMITYVPDDYFVGYDTFTYIASTRYANSDDAKVCVLVVERYPLVPEGFSPNGDGINDFLIIENIEKYKYNRFVVFNRWGNIVYEKDLYNNDEPWNGVANKGIRIGSGPLPAGVYLFILDLGDEDKLEKERRIIKGNIYVASDTR